MCPVLILGETGSGKTRLAREIHALSPRAQRPFVRVNCGAIVETLFEREMFGHVRGAFTDAREAGTGYIEAAQGGTLFLDEIGELPLNIQSKLLTILEDGTFRRIGSPIELRGEMRVIAATNIDIRAMVAEKRFRADLYHRLAVLCHTLPRLRERHDLDAVVQAVLAERVCPPGRRLTLSPAAYAVIAAYEWPGNIRELENALLYASVHAPSDVIEAEFLPEEVRGAAVAHGGRVIPGTRYVAPASPRAEREMIVAALGSTGGNRTRAARLLGMSRAALWIKLQRYGLHAPKAVAAGFRAEGCVDTE
jgi:DNA-binding NtrC family response regulator